MKLKHLELENVCLHRHFEMDFTDGLIGFFGPQGSGKTTAMNAAYAAITNDFNRFTGGKSGVPCQQAEEHEPSKIVLDAEHAATPFKLTRYLRPSAKHRLEAPHLEQPLTKAGEIEEALEGILGGSRHLLDNYVFVPQWGLRELFNLGTADRAKTLAHLCGTTHAELCFDVVGKQLSVDQELATTVVDNSDELRATIGDYTQRKEAAQVELSKLAGKILDKESKDYFDDVLRRRREHEAAINARPAKVEAESAKKKVASRKVAVWRKIEAERDEVAAAVAVEEARVAELEALRDEFKDAEDSWDLFQRAKSQYDKSVQELADLQEPPKPKDFYSKDEIDTKLDELSRSAAPHEAVIESLSGLEGVEEGAVCPTCGQELANPLEHLESAMRAIAPIEAARKEWADRNKVRVRYEQAVVEWEKTKGQIESRLAERKTAFEAARCEQPMTTVSGQLLEDHKEVLRQLRKRHQDLQNDLNAAVSDKATAIAEHKSAKAALGELDKKISDYEVDDDIHEEARVAIADHDLAVNAKTRQDTLIEQYDEVLAERQAELDNLLAVICRSSKARDWVRLLDQVRSVLHRDALPRIVHEAALRRMEDGINEMLEIFESPFSVKTSPEDLSYVAYFRNGTVMPAKGLSGGQQVVLALALRWTLNSLFASQIGMMVLDEPTAGLDDRHIDLLEVALGGLGETARNRGCQVVIITHERRLMGVFDQVIELDRAVA